MRANRMYQTSSTNSVKDSRRVIEAFEHVQHYTDCVWKGLTVFSDCSKMSDF